MGALRVHLDGGGGPGEWLAWVLDRTGCAAFAPAERDALAAVPRAIAGYRDFVHRHGGRDGACEPGVAEPVVAERIVGVDEGLFAADRADAPVEEIERAIRLLSWTRADLLSALDGAPEAALDREAPFRDPYPFWARWRTVREIVAHVAICETRYYLRGIGFDPGPSPPAPGDPEPGSRAWYAALGRDWRSLLERTRAQAVAFLGEVARSTDRRRIREEPGYCWSVRKALRRLVWHERVHTKSVRRILRIAR